MGASDFLSESGKGLVEIQKAINKTFYIESSCGDPDYTGELGYFGGPIPKNAR